MDNYEKLERKIKKWCYISSVALHLGLLSYLSYQPPLINPEKKEAKEIVMEFDEYRPIESSINEEQAPEESNVQPTLSQPPKINNSSPQINSELSDDSSQEIPSFIEEPGINDIATIEPTLQDTTVVPMEDKLILRKKELIKNLSNFGYSYNNVQERKLTELAKTRGLEFFTALDQKLHLLNYDKGNDDFSSVGESFVYNGSEWAKFINLFENPEEAVNFIVKTQNDLGIIFRPGNAQLYLDLAKEKEKFNVLSSTFADSLDLRIYDDPFGMQEYYTDRIARIFTTEGIDGTIKQVQDKLGIPISSKKQFTEKDFKELSNQWRNGHAAVPKEKTPSLIEHAELFLKLHENPEAINALERLQKIYPLDYNGLNYKIEEIIELGKADINLEKRMQMLKGVYPNLITEWNLQSIEFAHEIVNNYSLFNKLKDPENVKFLRERNVDFSNKYDILNSLDEIDDNEKYNISLKLLAEMNDTYGNFSPLQLEEITRKIYNGSSLVEQITNKDSKKFVKSLKGKKFLDKESLKPLISGNPEIFFKLVENRDEFLDFYDKLIELNEINSKWLRNNDFEQSRRISNNINLTQELALTYQDKEKIFKTINVLEENLQGYKFVMSDLAFIPRLSYVNQDTLAMKIQQLNIGRFKITNKETAIAGFLAPTIFETQIMNPDVSKILLDINYENIAKKVYEEEDQFGRNNFDFSDVGLIYTFIHNPSLLNEFTSGTWKVQYDQTLTRLNQRQESKREVKDGFVSALRDLEILSSLKKTDLFKIRILSDYLSNQENVNYVYSMLLADQSDTTSEHGGIGYYKDGKLILESIESEMKIDDGHYVRGPRHRSMETYGLFSYHNHALPEDNTSYSGTSGMGFFGEGDLGVASVSQRDGVVFTLLNDGSFNADYYTPNLIEIDLGIFKATSRDNVK